MLASTLRHVFLALCILPGAISFKPHDFKTCSQSGFCRRGRGLAERAQAADKWVSPYSVDSGSLVFSPGKDSVKATVKSSLYPHINFELELRVHEDGVVRVRMDEVNGLRKRYDEAASWSLVGEPKLSKTVQWVHEKGQIRGLIGEIKDLEALISFSPLRVALIRNGREEVVLNGQGLLHMEHFRQKTFPVAEETESGEDAEPIAGDQTVLAAAGPDTRWFEGEREDAYWEEQFGSWTDSKPKGPESFSIDINFPSHGHVYGIPQHATRLALPSTAGEEPTYSDPYRLFNADVFEYLASSPVSLYGSIPLMHAHSAESTIAVLNLVGSETWIDIQYPSESSTNTHWISESGIIDIFLLPGPTASDVFQQYARLTGTPALPAEWSLGYHQCRWNYVDSNDVRDVQKRFDEEDMPLEVLWLDIEYSKDHKYFIWDEKSFPDPVEMVQDVEAIGRKMVVIVDPHLKRTNDYPVYKKASELQVLVKPASGEGEYEGWCWSGSSSWVDFFNPASWPWWQSLFKIEGDSDEWHWSKSTEGVFIWNDMNEPSVFNGPEISMPRDNIHYGGWEHRDVHNINGMLFQNQTSKALLARSTPAKRPFVLTRSFFAGSQRFGAMWTGDNMGTWEHMAIGVPMVLSNGIAGMTFSGADVGGFFGNPDPEMLVRWYQVGIFAPFFRAHAHIDTKRREPYLLEEPHKSIVRKFLKLRYAMLPVWYTAFREASVTGVPILRPQYVVLPKDKNGFAIDDQYYIGKGLLVKPVVAPGVSQISVYLGEDQVYYNYFDHQVYRGSAHGSNVSVPAALDQIPLLRRGGSIIATKERPRRSSPLMKNDPFTLTIALSNTGYAEGELYLDAGDDFSYQSGEIVWRRFTAEVFKSAKALSIRNADMVPGHQNDAVDGVSLTNYDRENAFARSIKDVRVERIALLGLPWKPKGVKSQAGVELDWTYAAGVASTGTKEGTASVLVIKNPPVTITGTWAITIQE
ncbi:alpha-glucosidase [Sistotremastrum suecicum HHB10207 ss-3]|uniref:Glucosidase II subunit alpha n=1 Tax=Sistotremastrum suecicum HHB10207 ss-3 TaxID=1314776 RepID=A0A166GRA7_9AGAM|nr:alpha-glucosidase [Sistotremastrum suecicum HHB10207 ss-3]